jgi:hypothetical protein
VSVGSFRSPDWPASRATSGGRSLPSPLGGVALASLGRFGVVSAAALVVVVGVAWLMDQRRGRVDPERSSSATPVE